jgi:hypothetical protein
MGMVVLRATLNRCLSLLATARMTATPAKLRTTRNVIIPAITATQPTRLTQRGIIGPTNDGQSSKPLSSKINHVRHSSYPFCSIILDLVKEYKKEGIHA